MAYLRSYFIGINCFKDSFNVPWFIVLLCHRCERLVLLETRTKTSRSVLFGMFFSLSTFFNFIFYFFSLTFFYLKFWVGVLWDSTMKYKIIIWVWNPLICEMDRAFDKEGCELNNDRLLVRKQLYDDTGGSSYTTSCIKVVEVKEWKQAATYFPGITSIHRQKIL